MLIYEVASKKLGQSHKTSFYSRTKSNKTTLDNQTNYTLFYITGPIKQDYSREPTKLYTYYLQTWDKFITVNWSKIDNFHAGHVDKILRTHQLLLLPTTYCKINCKNTFREHTVLKEPLHI